MAITYRWKFGPMEVERTPADTRFTDVVRIVSWRLLATDGTRVEETSNRLAIPFPTVGNFKPLDTLTKQSVVNWVENNPAINVPALKAELAARFAVAEPVKPPELVVMEAPFSKDEVDVEVVL